MNSIIMFGAVLFVFILAYNYIQTRTPIQIKEEGFKVRTASDCNCLPGYIPSNTKRKEKTSFFFCQSLSNSSITKKCY